VDLLEEFEKNKSTIKCIKFLNLFFYVDVKNNLISKLDFAKTTFLIYFYHA